MRERTFAAGGNEGVRAVSSGTSLAALWQQQNLGTPLFRPLCTLSLPIRGSGSCTCSGANSDAREPKLIFTGTGPESQAHSWLLLI